MAIVQAFLLLIAACLAAFLSGTKGENPYGKVFANPNQEWHFALMCLDNQTISCEPKLGEAGKLNVTSNDKDSYCGACSNQTLVALDCIDIVKKDFLFDNTASTDEIRTAISTGCATGNFTVKVSQKSGGTKLEASAWVASFVSLWLVLYATRN